TQWRLARGKPCEPPRAAPLPMAANHPPPARSAHAIILMGVSGSGKTTVGLELAKQLGWGFRDADGFHPPANVEKMSAGLPLDDADRAPWLAAIRAHIDATLARGENGIVTCSALKKSYRAAAISDPQRVQLVHLAGDFNVILDRMKEREHFMKPGMLQSQFETLEPPQHALTIDIAKSPAEIVSEIRRNLGL
ncbi:MAG: gluconokinase, partial [Opitutaceae bacterium]